LASLPDTFDIPDSVRVLHNDSYQDMLVETPIPEPTTMAILAVGAVGLLRRRRRARQP